MWREEVIESTAHARDAPGQLVSERALAGFEPGCGVREGAVDAPPALGLEANAQGRRATGNRTAQSSIPVVGEDGTAISRDGMRPAR